MHSKFLNLDEDKQQRIINAAMDEFGKKGYKDASTNQIVKDAEISKGILFHYFSSKKQLFLFLYGYCLELAADEIYSRMDFNQSDFLVRLREVSILKMELLKKYPSIQKFSQRAYIEESPEVKEEIDKISGDTIKEAYEKLYLNIDFTLFRQDIDVQQTIRIIMHTFEGFSNTEFEKLRTIPGYTFDYDILFVEAEKFIDIFRKCFYKESIQ